MRIFVTGATGMVGSRVVALLAARGDQVTCLTRNAVTAAARLPAGVEIREGDPAVGGDWQEAVGAADAVINLAGESVGNGLWTRGKLRRIRRSRLAGTRNLVAAISAADHPVTLVSASAAGFYGDQGDRALGESAPPGDGFLARLAVEWENAAREAGNERVRVVLLRIGAVLDSAGGMLPRLVSPVRAGFGGRLGSGRQYVPWIHGADLARAVLFVLDQPAIEGPVNAVAPDPPTQSQFIAALSRVLGKPARLPVPAFALRLLLGRKAEIVLASQRAVPNALRAAGFRFEYGELDAALADLVRS
ncbi:MAG: TIGR01777 family protein [bacterium]|nr:TIGR01777 family protein [bacterium]